MTYTCLTGWPHTKKYWILYQIFKETMVHMVKKQSLIGMVSPDAGSFPAMHICTTLREKKSIFIPQKKLWSTTRNLLKKSTAWEHPWTPENLLTKTATHTVPGTPIIFGLLLPPWKKPVKEHWECSMLIAPDLKVFVPETLL